MVSFARHHGGPVLVLQLQLQKAEFRSSPSRPFQGIQSYALGNRITNSNLLGKWIQVSEGIY